MFESRISAGDDRKIAMSLGKSSYFFMVVWYGRSCEEICGAILWVGKQDDSTTLQSMYSMHWWPLFQRRRIEICRRIVKSMVSICSEMLETWHVLEDLIFDGQWTNLQDRLRNGPKSVTNAWIDWYFTSITHVSTNSIAMWVTLPSNAGWDCFKTPILQDILRIQNLLRMEQCAFLEVIHFVPISWMCKKQTSVSHSSTESGIISLDAGFRLDGIPALEKWDLIVAVFGNTNQSHKEQGDLLMNKREVRSRPHTIHKRKQSQRVIYDFDNVDFIPSNVQSSHQEALLYVFEDNEAVIKMIIKGRSPTMRHVSRTHRVAFDWLFWSNQFGLQNPNQIHWHQKPICWHTDQGKLHTWWMESSFVFV